jgi:peptidoglycan glycosyltransferase
VPARGLRIVARVVLWALPFALAGSGALAVRDARQRAELDRARLLLVMGDLASAREPLERVRRSRRHGAEARAGLAILRALGGSPGSEAAVPGLELDRYPVRLLLDQALRAGAFAGCEALAWLADESGLHWARVHRAAALLEQGREAEARTLADASPELVAAVPLGRRLRHALELRRNGAASIVRDHAGAPVGVLDSQRRLRLLPETTPHWIPDAAAAELAGLTPAAGVRLSVDLRLSRLAEEALGGRRGSVVLLDAHSGAVLAAVSDSRTREEGGTPAFEQRREPASIAKIVTAAAALRAGVDPDGAISRTTCAGVERYGRGSLWCSFAAGKLRGLDHALAISCNIAFATLAVEIGREKLLEEYRRWGFDEPPSGPLRPGRVVHPHGDARQLADLAVGLEATDVTPLHAALMAAVVGNGGAMPRPVLVTDRDGALGLSPRALPLAPPRPVLEPRSVPVLRDAMKAVTEYGTGAGLSPPGFPVAMKTGTSSEPGRGYHVNYIGIGPLPAADLAFCVRVTHLPGSPAAVRAGRDVTARLLDGLAAYRPAASF